MIMGFDLMKNVLLKIEKYGIRGIVDVTHQRAKMLIAKYKILNRKNNHFLYEMETYWKSYRRIEKQYLDKLKAMDTYSGSGKTSNIVWWCWLQGEDNCPRLQKICLASVREKLVDRKIIVITKDNLYNYIDFPDYIKEKYKKGYISNTHFSDLIRLQLLIKYGGTWIDSTALCTGYDRELFDKPLFVYKNLNYVWYGSKNYCYKEVPLIADNWFITAEINNPILITVRDLLFDYWNTHNYVIDYFIFHYFFTMTVNYKYKNLFEKIPLRSHIQPHLMQNVCYRKVSEDEMNDILSQATMHKLTNKVKSESLSADCLYLKLINENRSFD